MTLFDNEILNPTDQMLPIEQIKAKADEVSHPAGLDTGKLDMYPFVWMSATSHPLTIVRFICCCTTLVDDAQFAGRSYEYYERYDQVLKNVWRQHQHAAEGGGDLDAMTGRCWASPRWISGNNTWQWFWGAK